MGFGIFTLILRLETSMRTYHKMAHLSLFGQKGYVVGPCLIHSWWLLCWDAKRMRQLSTKIFENSLKPAFWLEFAAICKVCIRKQKLDFTVKKWGNPTFDCLGDEALIVWSRDPGKITTLACQHRYICLFMCNSFIINIMSFKKTI